MRVRIWELGAAFLGVLIALVYFLNGAIAIGVGILAAVMAGIAARMRPLEHPGVPGGHAREKAGIELAMIIALATAELAVISLLFVAAMAHWQRQPPGLVAIFALAALSVVLGVEFKRRMTEFENWGLGVNSEEAVAKELERLPNERWFVTHNLLKRQRGNIDHIAIASTGAFVIETKSRGYRTADGAQARGAALELRELTGIRWVTAVVCVPGADQPCKREKENVWVVPQAGLAEWLQDCRDYSGPPIDVFAAQARLA